MKLRYIALCTLIALPNLAFAEVKFNGFASIVGAKTMDDDELLYGFDDDLDFEQGSVFGLQGYADLGEGLSATVQILGKGSDDFDPEFEWAYVSYSINDEIKLNAGKLRIPFYMNSEYLDVGYAYNWVRPPSTVYSAPFSTYEGVRVDHSTYIGDWDSNLQVYYGGYDDDDITVSGLDVEMELNDIVGFSWKMNYEWFTGRIMYTQTEVTVLNDDMRAIEQMLIGAGLDSLANDVLFVEDDTSFMAVGFEVDYSNWLITSEFTVLDTGDNFFGDTDNYYVSFAYRFDKVTPYFVYGVSEDSPKSNPAAGYGAPIEQLVGGMFASQDSDVTTYSLGMRWDFHSSAAFKVEFHTYEDDIKPLTDADLVSMSVDLVF